MKSIPPFTCVLALAAFTAAAHANATADLVADYNYGQFDATNKGVYQVSGTAALGLPATTDGFGTDVTPFTPPFSPDDLTEINSGGHITLHLSAPITTDAGPQLGVFSNVGMEASLDSTPDNPIATTTTFSDASQAVVSVSADGKNFVALNAGNAIVFSNPTSSFSNSDVTYVADSGDDYVLADGGTMPTNFFKPFTGTLDDLNGETYAQMTATLDGSAGGTWLDVSSAGLAQINYVRFDVPAGDNLFLDAVTAVPEPASLSLFVVGLIALARRRQR